ncbi:restriction endonuclease subunit S [Vibrio cholerae]|nr:restriction endonuclease subunit S [Vibrio cholerae]EGR0508250.1 restriction endonuclease subunit S [Vibrio cholerae]
MSDMKGYPLQRLGELVSGNRGVSYKPENLKTAIDDNSVVLLRSNNIQSGTLNFENVQIVPDSLVSDSQILKKGDIAVCMSNGSRQLVGKSGMLQHEIEYPLTVGAFCSVFRCQNEDDSEYVRYLFQSQAYQHGIDVALAGSAINNLKNSDIEAIEVPTAPKKLRKKIAEILSTIDNQIDATQALIDKYTAIKQGMMADLFSRGIDPETKALRPTFEEAPELYHETPLGMLPKGWDVKTLGNAINGSGFIQTGPFGSQLHAYDYVDSGVPVVMPQDIVQGRISIEKIAYITERKAAELSRHKLKINDVIFSRRGDLTRSSFVDVQNGYEGFLCGTGCLLMRVDASNIVGGWFSYLYSSDLVQRQVEGLAVGTTMPNLNGSILKKLTIPFPSVEEQTHIFSKIASAQSLIDENAKYLGKLVAQKSGLMQDLLTGKVPVPA